MLTTWHSGVKTHKCIISRDGGQRQTSRLLQLFVEPRSSSPVLLSYLPPQQASLWEEWAPCCLEQFQQQVQAWYWYWERWDRALHAQKVQVQAWHWYCQENGELCWHSRCRCRCRQSAGQRSSLTFSNRYLWLQTEQCVFPAHLTFLLKPLYVHRGEITKNDSRDSTWGSDGKAGLGSSTTGAALFAGGFLVLVLGNIEGTLCAFLHRRSSREVRSTHPSIAVHPHRLCFHGDQPKLQKLRVIREAMKRKILVSTWRSIRTAMYTTGLHHCGRKKEPRSLHKPKLLGLSLPSWQLWSNYEALSFRPATQQRSMSPDPWKPQAMM